MRLLELNHSLLRHLNVFKHDLKPLSELKPTLFFELLDNFLLSIFKNSSLIQQSLGETILIEAFENIFVLEISENMNDAIDFLGDFYLSVVFKVFLELLIKVGDQRFCCLFILINEVFKGGFYRQVYVGVTIEGFLEQIDHFLSELDYVFDQFLVLDTFVFDQFLSFRDDVGFENRLELIQSFWASFE